MKRIVAAIVLAGLAGAAFSQQGMKPEDMVKFRKASMNFQAWNMGRIKASLEGDFNKDQVVAAANAVAAVANSGLGALFGPGTDQGALGEKTRLKADYIQQADKVKEVGMNFNREANELARVAASGDAAAVKAQFGETGSACKSCHDSFRAD